MLRKFPSYLKVLLPILWITLVTPALAELHPCIVCSVEQSKIHSEECPLSTKFEGQTYYFCEKRCQKLFSKDSKKWVSDFGSLKTSSRGLKPGDPLPAFRFPLEPAGSLSSSDVEGKILLLNFWANWCGPCLKEMPDLKTLQDELRPEGLMVVALSFDKTKLEHRRAVEKLELNFVSVFADQPEVQSFLKELGPIDSIPVTIVVDSEGNIVERLEGAASLEEFRKMVKPHLKDSSSEVSSRNGSIVPS